MLRVVERANDGTLLRPVLCAHELGQVGLAVDLIGDALPSALTANVAHKGHVRRLDHQFAATAERHNHGLRGKARKAPPQRKSRVLEDPSGSWRQAAVLQMHEHGGAEGGGARPRPVGRAVALLHNVPVLVELVRGPVHLPHDVMHEALLQLDLSGMFGVRHARDGALPDPVAQQRADLLDRDLLVRERIVAPLGAEA